MNIRTIAYKRILLVFWDISFKRIPREQHRSHRREMFCKKSVLNPNKAELFEGRFFRGRRGREQSI